MSDCDKSLGELREGLTALLERLEELERRVRRLETKEAAVWTVTPAPVWDA